MRFTMWVLAPLILAGCVNFEDESQRGFTRVGLTTPAAFTTADVRIITEREHPILHNKVICTEPSPDVAKALSTAFSLSGQGGNGTASGSAAGSAASSEAVAELAGRTTALLALRDGLFQTCNAFANGAVGADAYALVLSRYSQLMTTLFLGQDIAGAAATTVAAQSPSISVNAAAPASGSPGGASPGAAANTAAAATPVATASAAASPATGAANALVRMNEDYLNLDYNALHLFWVACVNRNDVTSFSSYNLRDTADPKALRKNDWLDGVCQQLQHELSPAQLQALARLPAGLVNAGVLGTPVNPTSQATTTTTVTQTGSKAPLAPPQTHGH
jgi:hypothetical protein